MLSYLLFYQISSLVNFISSITLSMLIFFRSSNNLRNRIFAYFCLSVGFWSLIYFLWLGATNQIMSDYLLRTCMIGVFFMPTLFIHFIVRFLEVKNRNVFLFVNYALSLFFAVFVYSPLYASDSAPFLIFNYWLKGNILCTLEIIHFVIVVLYSFFLMFRAFNNSTGVKRNQLLYIMVGTGVGYLCGAVNFFSWYRIPVPPFLNIFITFYVVLVAYAIIKYGLMDVRLAITNFSIFIGVYAFVLGFPFYFYAIGQKLFALFCMLVFATAGPFIYFYIQKRAEDKILEDQRRYQDTLRKAAAAMNRIKDVKKLFNLIVELITSGMRVDFTLVYVLDPHAKEYSLQAFKYIRSQSNMIDKISADSPLVGYLEGYHGAVTYDDMHHNPEVSQKFTKVSVIRALGELRFKDVLILPVLIEGKALAMIVLGKKQNGRIFTKDDLSVLSTLANQVALSVENCHYWVAETKRMEEQGLRERVASLDKNRFEL